MMPLEGIRVVELAAWMAGPACCAVLGDWGAEVIKVEHPVRGDPMRGILSIGVIPVGAINYLWELDNRNKKSLAVDLKQESGRQAVYRLVERSDVFVTNLQASELERLGMDYPRLSKLNPRLVYTHITGYGEEGPQGDRPGFDLGAWARSGFMATLGEPDATPTLPATGNLDRTTAMFAAGGIALALFVRSRTGRGQKISLSLLGSGLWCGGIYAQAVACTDRDIPRLSRRETGNPLYNSYQTRDGHWLVLIMLQTDLNWHEFCQTLVAPGLEHDPQFDSHRNRCAHNRELIARLDEIFATRTLEEWRHKFEGRNILWEPVLTYAELAADPQVVANDYLSPFQHPVYGWGKLVSAPVRLHETPGGIRGGGPQLGQDTEEVLLGVGYSWDDIIALKEAGAIP
jgi:crotonobetainyl-CoA:carnitine CoA-transferase CaiB-like acyl-CoA transferase